MFGPMDFILGGLTPLAAASAAFALAWLATSRGGAAWSAGVIVGFAAGAFALEARDSGPTVAAAKLWRPTQAAEWLTIVALASAAPALAAWLSGKRWIEWLLAAPLCVAAPAWLLSGKYRAAQQLRDAGFADDAITPAGAALVLAVIAAATLIAWGLWRNAEGAPLPRARTLLAILATVGAAVTSALTGSLAYAQAFGVLAATLGGCAVAAWFMGEKSSPEAARGPVLLLHGGMLALAVCYSSMLPWHAATLAAALALSVGCLPAAARRRPAPQAAVRTGLCLALLALVIWRAGVAFVASHQQHTEQQSDDEPYFR
jgi:hypothetical protein